MKNKAWTRHSPILRMGEIINPYKISSQRSSETITWKSWVRMGGLV